MHGATLCLAWTLFLRVDALGIASHLCFPASGGAFVAPRPAPDSGVEVGRLGGPQKSGSVRRSGRLSGSRPWWDTGPSAVSSGVCGPRWAEGASGTSVPFGSLVGAGLKAGTGWEWGRGPVPSLCPSTLALDPLWAALTRQSLVSSRLYGDHRKDQLGTVVTRFQGLACGSSCGLWGPQSLFPSQWHSLYFELFKSLGVGPQVHDLSLLPNASCCCCC